ncbi:hypothetical protein [Flavobacterium johnsoniae]
MVETTYNLNSGAAKRIMSSDTASADYIEVEKQGNIFIFENTHNSIFKVSKNPSKIEIIDAQDKTSTYMEERGYKITAKKNRDTLIIRFFPTRSTPASVFKFGIEYKFYK